MSFDPTGLTQRMSQHRSPSRPIYLPQASACDTTQRRWNHLLGTCRRRHLSHRGRAGAGRTGQAYNIVEDELVNWRGFTSRLAEASGTPRPVELPRWVLRLAVPYLAVMITSTLCASNARQELGWTLSAPTFREGIEQVIPSLQRAA